MNVRECPLCGIRWINGVPYWSHGNKPTTNANVASIVCKHAKPRDGRQCANPCGDNSAGCTDSWESRLADADKMGLSVERVTENAQPKEGGTINERYKSIFEEFGSE